MQSEMNAFPNHILALRKPKARWHPEEDSLLRRVVAEKVPSHWNTIALSLPGRTGKQCRERWMTKLSPEFISEPWTKKEDEILINLQKVNGNHWCKFRGDLPHRSTSSIKNRWVSLQKHGYVGQSCNSSRDQEKNDESIERIMDEDSRPSRGDVEMNPTNDGSVERIGDADSVLSRGDVENQPMDSEFDNAFFQDDGI
jgi:hypothetical protein